MARPQIQVEVAFETNPNDAAAVAAMTADDWTDITPWVRAIPTLDRSKRSTELDRFEAGTAKITVDNSDGRFSPANSSSPYAPNVKVYRMIRIRAFRTVDSSEAAAVPFWESDIFGPDVFPSTVVYPQWQGYVERWPTRWLDPAQGLAEIECVDIMAVAAQVGMSSVYEAEILADTPTWYYPLTEGSEASEAANQSTVPQPNAVIFHDSNGVGSETYDFGAQMEGLVGSEGTGLSMVSNTAAPYGMYGLRYPHISLNWAAWTIECWTSGVDAGGIPDVLFTLTQSPNADHGAMTLQATAIDSGIHLTLLTPGAGATSISVTGGPNLADGRAHHVALVWTSPTISVYVDGSLAFFRTTSSTFTGTLSYAMQSGSEDTIADSTSLKQKDINTHAGTIAQVAVYPTTALSLTRLQAHVYAGLFALYAQTSDQQAQALFDYAAWPATLEDVAAGTTKLASLTGIAGRSLLECLQDIADTENGAVFATVDGKLAIRSRDDRIARTTPAAIFGSNVAAGEIPYRLDSLQLDYDPTLVYNDVAVTATAVGTTARVYDSDSILHYFPRSLAVSTRAAYGAGALPPAQFLLSRYAQPALRVEAITIDAGSIGTDVPTLWPTLLALDINDRVRLIHRPMGQPTVSLDGYVDQLTEQIDPDAGTWAFVIQISPAIQDYWLLDDPVASVLDSTTRLAY